MVMTVGRVTAVLVVLVMIVVVVEMSVVSTLEGVLPLE